MKKRPGSLHLTDWKVLFFSPEGNPLEELVSSTPGINPQFLTLFNDYDKAIEALSQGDYTIVMSDISQHSPVARRLITWLRIHKPDVAAFFLGTDFNLNGQLDLWELLHGDVFVHANAGVDPLAQCLCILYSEDVPLKWLNHAKCECLQLRNKINRQNNNVVLLIGACGSGKAALAQISHFAGPRYNKAFIFVDCSPNEGKQSSDVWTEERAIRFRKSLRHMMTQAGGGTIYFHDIERLNISAQSILWEELNAIKSSNPNEKMPKLIICATKQHLEELVGHGDFSEELLCSINDYVLNVPSLFQYKEDIPLMAENLLRAYCITNKLPEKKFTKDALETIRQHAWEENIRGLFKAIKQSYVLAENTYIKPEHLNLAPHIDNNDSMIEQAHTIKTVLKKCKGVVAHAAIELGISRSHLYKLMAEFGIPQGYGLPPGKRKIREEQQRKKGKSDLDNTEK